MTRPIQLLINVLVNFVDSEWWSTGIASVADFCRQRLARSYETSRKLLRINFVRSNISGNIRDWAICRCSRRRTIVSPGNIRRRVELDRCLERFWEVISWTRSSATADGPRDALRQSKSCQLLHSCRNKLHSKSTINWNNRVRALLRSRHSVFAVSFWIGSGHISVAEPIESFTVARRHVLFTLYVPCLRVLF